MTTHALLLFGASYLTVFCLGFQSLVVNRGQYHLAFAASSTIGCLQLFLLKQVPQVTGWVDSLAYIAGGPLAICSAMYVHRRFIVGKDRHERHRDDGGPPRD